MANLKKILLSKKNKPRKAPVVLKKAAGAALRLAAQIIKQTKPDEIEVNKNGSITFRYKKEF